jgi:hypothetical protein
VDKQKRLLYILSTHTVGMHAEKSSSVLSDSPLRALIRGSTALIRWKFQQKRSSFWTIMLCYAWDYDASNKATDP